MYECNLCKKRAVVWDADFDFADYGEEGEGVIHEYHCKKCGVYPVEAVDGARHAAQQTGELLIPADVRVPV